jgi:hypothetical protein
VRGARPSRALPRASPTRTLPCWAAHAAKQFRRVSGYLHLAALRVALDRRFETVTSERGPQEAARQTPGPSPKLHGTRDFLEASARRAQAFFATWAHRLDQRSSRSTPGQRRDACQACCPTVPKRQGGTTVFRLVHVVTAVVAAMLAVQLSAVSGAGVQVAPTAYDPTSTGYTGIDPGAGLFYTYAPSIVQTGPSTRDVFYCGNSTSNVVHDHIFLSVGHLVAGQWRYGQPTIVFGPEDDPNPHGFFAYHTCEPEVIGGRFEFGGRAYRWALFFTAESTATNSTNQIGVAFANSPSGPYRADPTPIVQTADDFGQNGYPNGCPIDKATGQTLYCLGEPAATSIGGGRILLTYMGNSGSPGNASNPAEGLVLRELDLSAVPANGPCGRCFVTLPDGAAVEAVTQAGLLSRPHDASIAYDSARQRFLMSYDSGPYDTTANGPPVTSSITVATISRSSLLDADGSWQVQGSFGQCLSGYTYNHNSGIVRSADGDLAPGRRLEILYAVANNNLGANWGVWDYRLWDVDAALGAASPDSHYVVAATASCPGLSLVDSAGRVTVAGSAPNYGSIATRGPGAPVVGMALTLDRRGYYLATRDGAIETFGDARNQGSIAPRDISAAGGTAGVAVDSTTGGYWLVDANGAVYGFGAPVLGSLTTIHHSGHVAGISSMPNGEGYYVFTSAGEVYAFGHATHFGDLQDGEPDGARTVTAMAVTPDGLGYYLLTQGGTVAAFGDAQMFGPAAVRLGSPAAGIATTVDGFGYWVETTTGAITGFGDASSSGILPAALGGQPTVAIAAS